MITDNDNTVTRLAQKDHHDYIMDKFNSKCIKCDCDGYYHRVIDTKTKEIRFSKANGIVICDDCKDILDDPLEFLEFLKCEREEVYNDLIKIYT